MQFTAGATNLLSQTKQHHPEMSINASKVQYNFSQYNSNWKSYN